jgi:hypothetical protein
MPHWFDGASLRYCSPMPNRSAFDRPASFYRRLRTLQGLVLGFGLIPVVAGAAGVLAGPPMAGGAAGAIGLDSHFRYLSGLLLGIGLAYWSLVPDLPRHTVAFRLLTALVFAGGLARLFGIFAAGLPPPPMLAALVMELLVTPLLCLLQGRLVAD